LIAFAIIILSGDSESIPGYFGFVEGLIVNLGILDFSIGLASLISRYRPKALAIISMAAGILTMGIELAFIIF
jgi:hypothetical protein